MTAPPPQRWPHVDDVRDEVLGILETARHVVCLAHRDADADSLGSALGFAASLRAMGRVPHPVVPDPCPMLLSYLPGFDWLEQRPERIDAVFTFDCATRARFGEKVELLDLGCPVVNIDHHVSNEGYGSVNLIEPEASASGQVVYRLLRALDAPIPAAAATNLYAALFTDTGGFRHENTTEAALRLGAELVALGADPAFVALKSYKSRRVTQLRLEALAVAAMRADMSGRLIWSEVTRDMLAQASADMQESEGIIDQLQSIDTMEMAVLFKETSPSVTKISVRTRNPYDATRLCVPFGGGGHKRAAGAELRMSMTEAEHLVLPLARQILETP